MSTSSLFSFSEPRCERRGAAGPLSSVALQARWRRGAARPLSAFALLAGLFLLGGLSGCELYEQDTYQEYVVVEGYLVEGRALSPIRLSTTSEVTSTYAFDQVALSGAQVEVHLLDQQGGVEETFPYEMERPGMYVARDTVSPVLEKRTYRLEVVVPGRAESVRAETTVPSKIQIVGGVLESVIYQSSERLEILVEVEEDPVRQSVFLFNTIALDTLETNLTPFYRSAYENGDTVTLTELSRTSSGALNEGNFTRNPDGTITIQFPWIGVAFYGRNDLIFNLLDANIYDLLRSSTVQLGGSTLSPGEIQNVIYRVEGGIGVFGSIASDTARTVFVDPFQGGF